MRNQPYYSDLVAIHSELLQLMGQRLQNVYDAGKGHTYLFKFQGDSGKFVLLKPGIFAYRTDSPPTERRTLPTSFCAKLRKHLKNKRLESVRIMWEDRVLGMFFGFPDNQYCLTLELYGEGNLTLHQMQSSVDTDISTPALGKVLAFVYPHKYGGTRLKVGQIHPKEESYNTHLSSPTLPSPNPTPLARQLLNLYVKDISREVMHLLPEASSEAAFQQAESILAQIRTLPKGIIYQPDRPGSTGDCVAYPFQSLSQQEGVKVTQYATYSQALEAFTQNRWASLQTTPPEESAQDKTSRNPVRKTKETVIRQSNQQRIDGMLKRQRRLDQWISLLQEHQTDVTEALSHPEQLVVQGPERLCSLPLGNPAVQVTLKAKLSYHANLGELYRKRKELEAKIAKTSTGLEKALLNVAQRKRRVETQPPKVTLTTDRWYHQFYWFRTGNGLLAVCGKNASQNEEIVKRRMEKHDLYFHSEAPGSGSCVLKNPDQQTVTPSDQEEVGHFVVCMSRTWKAGVADRAYWVYPDQVSKTTETGEYVTTGAFIVRGKRNYTSLANLELGASVQGAELMIAPYRCILKQSNPVRAKIIPGKNRRNQVLAKLVGLLNLQSSDKTLLDQCLPIGIHLV